MQIIQKINFFSILILCCLIISIYYCSEIVDSSFCCEDCSLCQSSSVNPSDYTCLQCKNNLKLDKQANKCICNQNLFLQSSQTGQQNSNQCVALCQNSYFGNNSTNICEKLQECSTLITTSNQLITYTQVIEAHQLSEDMFIAQYKGVSTLINIQNSKILKSVNLSDEIIIVKVIQGNAFLFDQNNKIFKWNVNFEQKELIYDFQAESNLSFSSRNNLIQINQRYVCAIIVDEENKQIQFRNIFDLYNSDIIELDDNQYQSKEDNSQLLILENIIISLQDSIIIVQQIIQKEKLLIEQICSINTTSIQLTQIQDFDDNITVIKLNNKEILYINTKQQQQQYCKKLETNEIKDNIESIKVQTLTDSNNFLLVLKEYDNIFIYDSNSNFQKLNLNIDEKEAILDYQITYLQTKYPEIVILTNLNNIYTYVIKNNKIDQNQFEKTELQMVNITKIVKIQPINQNYSPKLGILLLSPESLTIIKRNSTNLKIEQTAHINYQMPFPPYLGRIKKIIIIEIYFYLVLCTENGYIQIFDISSGYGAHLVKNFNMNPDLCIDIQSILSEKIIAILSTKIVIIDLFTCIQEVLKDVDQKNIPSMSVNGQFISLCLNGCIYLYQSSQFQQVFEYCEEILQESILSISLSQDLVLYLISKETIKSVQIDLQDQKKKKINDLNIFTIQEQNITYYEIISVSINDQFENEFYIDEILVFYDYSHILSILNKDLIITHSLNISNINNPNMIKRAINDPSFYVIIESVRDPQQSTIVAFTKSESLVIIQEKFIPVQSLIIHTPIKLINENGVEYFLIKQFLFMNSFCVILETIIYPSSKKMLDQGGGATISQAITYSQTILDMLNNKSTTYAGTEIGELIQRQVNNNYYQVIEIKFQNNNDEIIQFVKFQIIEKYYILVQSYVHIFNIFTDEIETTIEFDLQQNQNAKISVIEKNNLFVYSSDNYVFVRNYKDKQTFSDHTYSEQKKINELLFDENDQSFYIYGSGFKKLDTKLQQKKEILSDENLLEKCIINQINFICKLDSLTLIIIDKKKPKNQQKIQVKGFKLTFIMKVDTQYSLLYLVEYSIQVYSLQGTFSTSISLNYDMLYIWLDIQDDYLMVSSQSSKFLNTKLLL